MKQLLKTLKGEHIVKHFKGYGLYNIEKNNVKKWKILTENDTCNITQLSISITAETFTEQSSIHFKCF